MNHSEQRNVLLISSIYATRMLGLFMLLPVFMLAGAELEGATPALLGLALGIYGLSQALLQIPFGWLSDRFGRKPLLLIGLLLFATGGVVAALSDHIAGVILGRFMQGAGAIASVLMAALADLTREENRSKAMAGVGMSIGLAFALSLILGPLVLQWRGLSAVFWFTAAAALCALLAVLALPAAHLKKQRHGSVGLVPAELGAVLGQPDLRRLDLSIFALHFILTALFVATPLELGRVFGLPITQHGWIYLGVMLASFILMLPAIIIGEKKEQVKSLLLLAVGVLAASLLGLLLMSWLSSQRVDAPAAWSLTFWIFLAFLFLFFWAFNYLEATLPSILSRLAPGDQRGTAMGVYSSGQFLGAFLGGLGGGFVLSLGGIAAVYGLCAMIALLWIFAVRGLTPPRSRRSLVLSLKPFTEDECDRIMAVFEAIAGVEDVTLVPDESLVYLRVNRRVLDETALKRHPLVSES